jgi:hypothetical protein
MDTEMSPLPGLLRSSATMGSDRSNTTMGRTCALRQAAFYIDS